MKIHSSEKKFKCEKCEMRFRHKNSLVRHMWQHEDSRPQQCKDCGRQFVSANRLRNHAKTHTKEQDEVVKTNQSKVIEEETSSLCYIIFDVVELTGL